jgi:Replication initiator protein, pSAM2
VATATAVRPVRATTAADLAAVYKLPEPPSDLAGLAGWEREVRRAAYCANPVWLAGRVEQADKRTGEVRETYSTEHEPDGVLLKACGNRRASVCPACAEVYRRDAWHLSAAGLRGGKGIPETVSEHPRLFVTFTAPSFGPVHTRRTQHGNPIPCRPRDPKAKCEHGRPVACWHRHPEAELRTLGRPLCDDCFDWTGLALWNALAPELWRRTLGVTIYRTLAHLLSTSEAEVKRLVRVRYMKVAEYQARGAIHFHAIIRLDAAPSRDDPEQVAPPPEGFTAELLAEAVKAATATVVVPYPPVEERPVRLARWGEQLDVRNVTRDGTELSAEAVAAYVAKYATKSTEALVGLDRRIRHDDDLDHLKVVPHLARLVRVCWELGAHPALAGLRLRAWAHALGFRGHWSTRSRRYSTTFTALRRTRVVHALRRRLRGGEPLDAWGRRASEEAAVVLGTWSFVGRGYSDNDSAVLAVMTAARTREYETAA